MKKVITVLCVLLMLLFMVGCSSESTVGDTNETAPVSAENQTTEEPAADQTEAAADTQADVSDASEVESETENTVFHKGETWTVEGQWELTVTDIAETEDRNEFSDKNPAAVYIVSFVYKNVGYVDSDGVMNGLYFVMDDSIVDSAGFMGYSYPGDVTDYPQETPVGASCKGQVCIGVDNAGLPITLNVELYDGNEVYRTATFIVE